MICGSAASGPGCGLPPPSISRTCSLPALHGKNILYDFVRLRSAHPAISWLHVSGPPLLPMIQVALCLRPSGCAPTSSSYRARVNPKGRANKKKMDLRRPSLSNDLSSNWELPTVAFERGGTFPVRGVVKCELPDCSWPSAYSPAQPSFGATCFGI